MQAFPRIAAAALAAVMLAACSAPAPAPEPGITPGARPTAPPAIPVIPSQSAQPGVPSAAANLPGYASTSGSPASASSSPGTGEGGQAWGSYRNRIEACSAVAANVAALLLVPLGFMTEVDPDDLQALQAELEEFSRAVPRQLVDDLERVEHQLAQAGETRDFDAAAFAEALQPVEDWLAEHCGE